jgi:magnesium chelatase subunit I
MENSLPTVLGAFRASEYNPARLARSVKDEFRDDLISKLHDSAGKNGQPLFPGIVGYEVTVVPPIVSALLSKHKFMLLGLSGQAKNRDLTIADDAAR